MYPTKIKCYGCHKSVYYVSMKGLFCNACRQKKFNDKYKAN